MKITDTQLLDFRNAVRHKDYVAAARILKDVRRQNPSAYNELWGMGSCGGWWGWGQVLTYAFPELSLRSWLAVPGTGY